MGTTMVRLDDNLNAEILTEFVAESREMLERVEPLVIELERGGSPNSETLSIIFRCFHSFKGTASFIDLTHTAALAHSAESLLDLYRRGATIEPNHVDLVCRALDIFRAILDAIEVEQTDQGRAGECTALARAIDRIVEDIKRHSGDELRSTRGSHLINVARAANLDLGEDTSVSTRSARATPRGSQTDSDHRGESTFVGTPKSEGASAMTLPAEFLIRFVAESDEYLAKIEEVLVAMESGTATEHQVADGFRAMHSFKGNCGICGYADMEQLTHRAETLMGEFRDKRRASDEQSISVLLDSLDMLRGALSAIPGGDGRLQQLQTMIERMDRLDAPSQNPTTAATSSVSVQRSLASGKRSELTGEHVAQKGGGSIRVDTDKLDELMNLVGELIIAETTVTQNPDLEGYEFENFQKAALNLNRLTRALQDITMAVRMVPIATTFRKMVRLVRDVSTKQEKRVELVLAGEDTEVDKTVLEAIADPLVHLIRNSIDHGIEQPAERVRASKEASGHVWLDAKHQGGEVWITVRDDGRGLDTERVLKKAVERGIADATHRYSEREIFEFIFEPGFSTAPQITEISGRGVGMDVVRRNLEGVNGRVEVSSVLGRGVVFTLRIPLTLAIIEGMLVRVGGSFYTIPLLAIRESVKARASDITHLSDGGEVLKLRRRHYPMIKLSEVHAVEGGVRSALDGILVIVEAGERLACVLVDEVVGQRQTVIKPLPEYVKRARGLAGCSILHNGHISLILDVEGLVGSADSRAA